eukprot:1160970-Pelagomonas_calceolata.AAC.6
MSGREKREKMAVVERAPDFQSLVTPASVSPGPSRRGGQEVRAAMVHKLNHRDKKNYASQRDNRYLFPLNGPCTCCFPIQGPGGAQASKADRVPGSQIQATALMHAMEIVRPLKRAKCSSHPLMMVCAEGHYTLVNAHSHGDVIGDLREPSSQWPVCA